MSLNFPYTLISCPCAEQPGRNIRHSPDVETETEADYTFDPRDPISAYSLFPPGNLFYCDDCREIRCPRCVNEEVVCYYCPQCLFETPYTTVRADLNRCASNCYQCPICMSQLGTTLHSNADTTQSSYLLSCPYCAWTSLDSGISFTSPKGIRTQMDAKLRGTSQPGNRLKKPSASLPFRSAGTPSSLSRVLSSEDSSLQESGSGDRPDDRKSLSHQARFDALKSFYDEQIRDSDPSQAFSNPAFSSPTAISRIMNLYGIGADPLFKKQKHRSGVMREALLASEGFQLSEDVGPTYTEETGFRYDDVPSPAQLAFQYPTLLGNPSARHVSQLRPMPTQLRTKRLKRCPTCSRILIRPEAKVTSTRYRVRLLALDAAPFVSMKPLLNHQAIANAAATTAASNANMHIGLDGSPDVTLPIYQPSQWILTLRNPLFEQVDVSLGTPSTTPGKFGHKVTILCPQFTIGKNGDSWDDVVQPDLGAGLLKSDTQVSMGLGAEQIAGKVYDRGKNWTSVVIEIVCAPLVAEKDSAGVDGLAQSTADENIVEIPIRVRLTWKITEEEALKEARAKVSEEGGTDDGSRELEYWMVLGVGRVK